MTYIIKNILSRYPNQSVFNRFLGATILALILLIGGSSSAWAQTVTATWSFRTGGNMWANTSVNDLDLQNSSHSVQTTPSNIAMVIDASTSGAKFYTKGRSDWAQTNTNTKFRVPVVSTDDIVSVEMYSANSINIGSTPIATTTVNHHVTSVEVSQGYVEITCTADTYLGSISVSLHNNVSFVANWDWQNTELTSANGTGLTPVNINSDINGVSLEVFGKDGGNYKLSDRGSDAQFNNGTVIRVPVYSVGDKISIVANYSYAFTVAGTAASDLTTQYVASSTDVANGYVEIIATGSAYLYSMSLTHHAFYDFALPMIGDNKFFGSPVTDGKSYYVVASSNGVAFMSETAPEFYNAEMSFRAYNGDQHGYENMVAKIPVTPGKYDVTIGNCNVAGTNSGYYKLSVGSGTVSPTEINANTNCYHLNTASNKTKQRVIVSDATTLTIMYGGNSSSYTPYFAIEKLVESGHSLNVSVTPDGAGTIEGDGSYPAETSVTLNATANRGYRFVKWTDASDNQLSTSTSYNVTMPDEDVSYNAVFEALPSYTISFSSGEVTGFIGSLPSTITNYEGETWTVPVNHTLYKEGYTLVGWSDGSTTYHAGDIISETKALTPVFVANTKSIATRASAVTATWDFQRGNGAPTFALEGAGATGFLVTQATVDGTTIDCKLDIDAVSGKFNNASWTDWAQVNNGTKFTVPSCKNATITAFVMQNATATTIAGEIPTMSSNNASVTTTSAKLTQQIVASSDIQYIRSITVVYPVKEEDVSYTATWDWNHGSPSTLRGATAFEGTSGTLASDNPEIEMTVDASSGKMAYDTYGHTYLNAGTKIRVPIKAEGDKVSFYFHSYNDTYRYFKAHGKAMTGQKCDYVATAADAAAGYVEFVADGNTVYIYSMSVSHSPSLEDFVINLMTNTPILPDGVEAKSESSAAPWYNGDHGWANYVFKFTARESVKITMQTCCYGANACVKDAMGKDANVLGTLDTKADDCSGEVSWFYISDGTAKDLYVYCGDYCHFVKVEKVDAPEENEVIDIPEGLYDFVVTNVDELNAALAVAGTSSDRNTIFVMNGTYELGTEYDTQVKDYTTLVGQSRDGVIIQNHPTTEGIWSSATLKTGSNVIIQNLTLHSIVAYNSSTKAERGTALYDEGSGNVYKNIRLLGRQDTYYSHDNATSFFEDCEIHGAVDFICGSGNVWFEKCDLLIESSSEAYITAARKHETGGYNGYIFNECTIDNADGANMAGKYYLGRAWDNQAKVSYYKTTKNIAPHGDKWTVMEGGKHLVSIDSESSPSNPRTLPITQKPVPASITVENGVITWSAVTGAKAYAIFKGNGIIAVVDKDVRTYYVGAQSSAKGFGRHKAASISDKKYSVAAIDADGVIGELATDREVAALDASFFYDFRLSNFDFNDHELISTIGENCKYNGAQHGWEFDADCGFSVQVVGNARVDVSRCMYGGGKFTVTSDNGGTITPNMFAATAASDGGTITINYEGPATTLNFVSDGQSFVHSVRVTNDGAVAVKFEDTKDKVTIHNNLPGAYVYYTIDGTEPTTTNYKERFSEASHVVSSIKDCWVKAICVMDGEVIHSVSRFCRSTFAGFSWDFSNGSTLLGSEKSSFSTGVVIDDRGNTFLVPVGDLSSSIDITTAYHDGQHGYVGIEATVPVDGPVIVTIGNCKYGNGKIIIKTAEGASVSLDPSAAGNCYDGNKTENFVRYEYTGGPTVLTIVGEKGKTVYIPYLSVRDASATRVKFVNRYPKTLLGTAPDEVEVNEAHQAFIPYNTTLYREGWAVTGWEDSETGTKYELGRSYTFYNNATLYPVLTKCTKAITDTNEPLEVTWPFDQLDGAPRFTLHNSNSDPTTMTYVKSVNVEGSMVDVPLVLDATLNKIDNNDDRVNALEGRGGQFNDNSAIILPAVYGMTITLNASEKNDKLYDTTTKFSGENCAVVKLRDGENFITGVVSDDGKSVTFTYNGDSPTIDVFIEKSGSGSTWGFFHSLSVTYPVLPNVVLANVITNADAEAFPNEDPANAGEATVTLQSAGASHTNTGSRFRVGDVVKLQSKAEYGYELAGFRKRVSEGDPVTITYTGPTTLDDGSTVITAEFTVVDEGITTIEALFTRRSNLVKITATSADINLGNVSLSPKYSNLYNKLANGVTAYYVPGTAVSVSAEAEKDYIIEKWVDGETEISGKNVYPITATVGENKNIVAHFKLGAIGTVIFDISNRGVHDVADPKTFNSAVSITPASIANVRSFYVPNNYTFFRDQHTLTHWVDTVTKRKYEPGKYYSFEKDGDVLTLTPVFVHNIADKENRTRGDALYWDFRTANLMQEIDIEEPNKDFFWTSKVSVQVIEDGERRDHTRDVALWIHTNSEGFVRNNDLPEWVTFGPGTKIDIPSCAGATLKMYTYSEITSTTFDGHIPVIDEAATRELHEQGEVGYVYTYTTSNPEARVSIVIGDDNSYYKWVRCYSLPASRMELHMDVDDDVHGEIVEIRGNGEFEAEELADGGFSFQKGNRVHVTFKRKFGYEFEKIVDLDKMNEQGTDNFSMVELERENGVITGVKMVASDGYSHEDAVKKSDGSWVSSLVTLRPLSVADGEREAYELDFGISSHRNLEIRFKAKPTYYVTFSAGDVASGIAPEPVWVEAGDKFTIPYNKTLFYNDHTLKAWEDEYGNQYTLGTEYTAPAKDLRLHPVFVENTFTILDIEEDTKVTWELTKRKGAPNIEYERSSGLIVSQLYKGSDFIDLKIDLNASDWLDSDGKEIMLNGRVLAGKFNNMAYDDRCQINEYSSITFSAIRGCVIELEALDNIPTAVKISGDSHEPAKTISYTHVFGRRQHSVEFESDGDNSSTYSTWCTALSITYKPFHEDLPELSSVAVNGGDISEEQLTTLKANKEITVNFVVGDNDDFPEVSAVPANGLCEIIQANLSTRKAEIVLVSNGGLTIDTYTINFNATVSTAPELEGSPSIYVNTTGYNASAIPWDQPIDGTISINFNRTMAAVGSGADIKLYDGAEPVGEALTAHQGSTLVFRYWDLDVDKEYTLTIPANTLHDVYNGVYSDAITVTFKTAKDIISVEHRKFNWIVGVDGTLSEGINAANSTGGLARFYIFVPDGEYELEGNDNIVPTTEEDATTLYDDEGNRRDDLLGANLNNKKTTLTRANVSIIGQSQTGTKIYNHPVIEGIDYTATLHLPASATDFYAQDLTLENRFNYRRSMGNAQNSAARAVALQGHGDRMILKNVSLWSYQDTYYSSNTETYSHFCSYLDNCSIAGVVDWVCGGGNIWLEKCDLIHRDRAGNNMAAPHTNADQEWGMVFNNCTIKPEVEVGSLQYMTDKDWTLARPWGTNPGQSPACTFINTTMSPLPRDAGWGLMYGGMVLRFHEYKTRDASGNLVSLANRSLAACAPAVGSDDCILSDAEASAYKVNEVLEFNPTVYTAQRNAVTDLSIEDGVLTWKESADKMDLCYFIFKKDADGKWKYFANVAETSFDFNLYGEDIREGIFMVRAANQRGGLGAFSDSIEYKEIEKFNLTITEVGTNPGMGWSTICLPNNAKVPSGEIWVYAAVSINDNVITLKKVDYVNANVGYVVYGKAGTYTFRGSSNKTKYKSYLSGNPSDAKVSASTTNCYTLAYKANVSGIGFYKYTGTWLNPYKAYLDVEVFKQLNNSSEDESALLSKASAKGIRFVFAPDDDVTNLPLRDLKATITYDTDAIYDLSGRRILNPLPGHIYIINGTSTLWQ